MRAFPFRLGLLGTIGLAAVSVLTFPRVHSASAKPARAAGPAVAEPGDPQLIDVAGYNDLIARSRGRAVMVNFWATWCEPCRNEYPLVMALAKEYGPQGLEVIGITTDEDTDMNAVRAFLAQARPTFPNYRERVGPDATAFYHAINPGWSGTMPQTDFYARDGHLARYFVGDRPRDAFVQAIRLILAVPLGENRSSSPVAGN